MASSPQKRKAITVQTKHELCEYRKLHPATHEQLAQHFNIGSRAAVSKIIKTPEKWLAALAIAEGSHSNKKLRGAEFPQLDQAVKLWFDQMRSNKLILTDAILLEKAEMFARGLEINLEDLKQFKASHGWLQRFKKRQHIKSYCLHGEAESAPVENLEGFRKEIQEVLKNYNLEDMFNTDEIGLFYRMAPSQTLGTSPEKGYKKDKCRVTVLLTCNATSTEKLKPLVIGNVGQPRCYKNINMAALPRV